MGLIFQTQISNHETWAAIVLTALWFPAWDHNWSGTGEKFPTESDYIEVSFPTQVYIASLWHHSAVLRRHDSEWGDRILSDAPWIFLNVCICTQHDQAIFQRSKRPVPVWDFISVFGAQLACYFFNHPYCTVISHFVPCPWPAELIVHELVQWILLNSFLWRFGRTSFQKCHIFK